MHCADEPVQRRNDEKHDRNVSETNSREGDNTEHRSHHECGDQRRAPRGDLRSNQIEDQDDADAGEGGRQPGGELVVAERAKRGGLHPVEQNRLLEPGGAVQIRSNKVAAREHLTRGLGESWFVRLPERSVSESCKDGEAGNEEESTEVRAHRTLFHTRSPPTRLQRLKVSVTSD